MHLKTELYWWKKSCAEQLAKLLEDSVYTWMLQWTGQFKFLTSHASKTNGWRCQTAMSRCTFDWNIFNIAKVMWGNCLALWVTTKTQSEEMNRRTKEDYLTDTGLLYLRTWTSPERSSQLFLSNRNHFSRCNTSSSQDAFEKNHII